MVRVAINGFGRIGRLILRAGLYDKKIEFVAVNDLGSAEQLAHLLKYDSVHGTLAEEVSVKKNIIYVGKKQIKVYNEMNPAKLSWKKDKIDVVCECTGRFVTKKDCMMHLKAGAKKVLLSAPAKGDQPVKTVVRGVNHQSLSSKDTIVSNGSCTTNCLGPVAHLLNENYGIEHGLLHTIHAYTSSQNIVDGPSKDPRRARAAAINMIPTSTGAARTIAKVIPALDGKIDGMATRVPLACGSLIDFTCALKEPTSKEELDLLFRTASQNELRNVLQYSTEPLVSSDIIHNPHSAIYDSGATMVLNPRFVKIIAWYDNEWGFCNRMIDVAKMLGSK